MKECPVCHHCYDDEIKVCSLDETPLKAILIGSTSIGNDRYVIEKRLGKGGMGIVFKAKHKYIRTEHALKIIHPNLVEGDESLLNRFRQEAILAASIHHPNVIRVTDFGVENDTMPYLVMEYVDGVPLSDYLTPGKQLSPEKVFEIFLPISLGVGEAHLKGIVHRDLKPQNIMVQNGLPIRQAIKVYDFGLAKIKSAESLGSFIQAKTLSILGSPPYMSPEQWENHPSDHRSDIYSIGVMLFQMLCGQLPFEGDSIPTMMYRHLMQPPPTFESLGISLPPGIEEIIQKCMQKDKDARPDSLEEVFLQFEDSLLRAGILTQTSSQTSDRNNPGFKSFNDIPSSAGLSTPTISNRGFISELGDSDTLSDSQKSRLKTYFDIPQSSDVMADTQLAQKFLQAQDRVEEAKEKVSEADKLVQDLAEAEKMAADAQRRALEAKEKVEEEVRRRVEAEMEEKLALQQKAWQEQEAQRLAEEAEARKQAEERANQMAQAALEAQRIAEQERLKAEHEAHQREVEESVRREAEIAAHQLAQQISDAQFQYQIARQEAEREAQLRQQAEAKQREIEHDLELQAHKEIEIRRLAEAEAQRQIDEQAIRYEQEALAAQQRIESARERAQLESQKREEAEAARLHAEQEAARLAQEIQDVQKHIDAIKSKVSSNPNNPVSSTGSMPYPVDTGGNQPTSLGYLPSDPTQISFAPHTSRSGGAAGFADVSSSSIPGMFGSNAGQAKPKSSMPIILGAVALSIILLGAGGLFIYFNGIPGVSKQNVVNNNDNTNVNLGGSAPSNVITIMSSPENYLKNNMAKIQGGTFTMGSNDVPKSGNDPFTNQYSAHQVTVKDFYIDKYEVSNNQYQEFVNDAKYTAPSGWKNGKIAPGEEKYPVVLVNASDAQKYTQWASGKLGKTCRLPTEEEWEYAARNGTQQTTFPWGNEWQPDKANLASPRVFAVNSGDDVTISGGLVNMMGNVSEWTSTKYALYPGNDGTISGDVSNNYVVRGGSTATTRNLLDKSRWLIGRRISTKADALSANLGFRMVCQSN